MLNIKNNGRQRKTFVIVLKSFMVRSKEVKGIAISTKSSAFKKVWKIFSMYLYLVNIKANQRITDEVTNFTKFSNKLFFLIESPGIQKNQLIIWDG